MYELTNLNKQELSAINGGSEATEAVVRFIGFCLKKFVMGVPETGPSMGRL